jgi:hypothetical protein
MRDAAEAPRIARVRLLKPALPGAGDVVGNKAALGLVQVHF